MAPLGNGQIGLRRPGVRAVSIGRGHARQAGIAAAISACLMLIGRDVAVTLDSPLLAIVAVGMAFLIGVAAFGAIDSARH